MWIGCVGWEPPVGNSVKVYVCQADMARTFERVLQFLKCNTLIVLPNLIVIIICCQKLRQGFKDMSKNVCVGQDKITTIGQESKNNDILIMMYVILL